MSERPSILSSRPRAGGSLAGVADAAPQPPEPASKPAGSKKAPARRATPRSAAEASPPAIGGVRLRFAGQRKAPVSTRVYPVVWDAYADAARALTRAGPRRVHQGDLVNAVLAIALPATQEEADAVMQRFREMLDADPPGDLPAY